MRKGGSGIIQKPVADRVDLYETPHNVLFFFLDLHCLHRLSRVENIETELHYEKIVYIRYVQPARAQTRPQVFLKKIHAQLS